MPKKEIIFATMKYRYLSDEELSYFAEELKQFLIINGIYHEEWLEMNQHEPEKARDLIGIFSNQILERVYANIHFLEQRFEERFTIMHITEQESELIMLERKPENTQLSFSTPENIHAALVNCLSDIQFFTAKKINTQAKTELIHHYIMQGFIPSTHDFWESLKSITK